MIVIALSDALHFGILLSLFLKNAAMVTMTIYGGIDVSHERYCCLTYSHCLAIFLS
jgi:hypothetical protein